MTEPKRLTSAEVRPADYWDLHAMASTIAHAFCDLAVSEWLVPDPEARLAILYHDFLIHADFGLRHGESFIAGSERHGVAIWHELDGPEQPASIEDYDNRLELATGPYVDRFRALNQAFDKHHPSEPHHYFAFLAVDPIWQGAGTGTALLHHRHRDLDRRGIPAYLVASSPQSRQLYLRHGYRDHGPPLHLPDGPQMWPMWRLPRPSVEP